ncbi:hypothetical protein WJX79_008747 [Trebouxia sp. C0005]
MADVQLYYLSKGNTNFPSLSSPEQSRTEIAQTFECLNAMYLQLKQNAGKEARLVCDLSHNNLTYEHLKYLTVELLASPVHLYALDLSWNRIFAATWPEELQDMLKHHVSFTAPNRYLGSTDWIRDWTTKAHEFRQKAYREEAEDDLLRTGMGGHLEVESFTHWA